MESKTNESRVRRNPVRQAREKSEVEAAVERIQALARGAQVRKQQTEARLFAAWNELDHREECELMESHQQYEQLKQKMAQKLEREQKEKEEKERERKEKEKEKEQVFLIPTVPKHRRSSSRSASASSSSSSSSATASSAPSSSVSKEEEEDDDGLTLSDPIRLDYVTALMDHFKANQLLDVESVLEILRRVKPLLAAEPNVVDVKIHTRLTVVGDLHGQLDDLLHIFKLNGLPSARNCYLFNGDFVDRGQFSCEVVLLLFCFKLLYPQHLFLNRGNHEARDINGRDGFEKECIVKYNKHVFDVFSDVFAALPLAHILDGKVFVVHGGLFWDDDIDIAAMQAEERFHEVPPTDSIAEQMMWSDPMEDEGRQESPRGASLLFGPDVTKAFLKKNKLELIIRSHECMQGGFEKMHGGSVLTVFSASNYCGTVGNEGAFVIFEKDLIPRVVTYYAKAKERLSRWRMRRAQLQSDIIAKLLQRISDHRLALVDYYRSVESKESGIGTVTRAEWAAGLRKVLKLNIPFLEFQDYLGLPKLGVDGRKKGNVDYMAFLLRFRPVNTLLSRDSFKDAASSTSSAAANKTPLKAIEHIIEMLSRNRFELESLFRHFDVNGDDEISVHEFKDGVLSLQALMDQDARFTEEEVDALIKHIDVNGDGHISYTEFFDSFTLVDSQLAQQQQQRKKNNVFKKQSSSSSSSSSTPSSPCSPGKMKLQRSTSVIEVDGMLKIRDDDDEQNNNNNSSSSQPVSHAISDLTASSPSSSSLSPLSSSLDTSSSSSSGLADGAVPMELSTPSRRNSIVDMDQD